MSKKIVAFVITCLSLSAVLLPSTSSAEASSIKYKYVNVSSDSVLNVREEPTTKSDVLFKLKNNSKIEIVDQGKKWSKIEYKSKKGYVSSAYLSKSKESATSKAEKIIEVAKKQLGKPYVFGSSGPSSFDCSGFVYYVMNKSGVDISRKSSAGHWASIDKVKSPQVGDVIFLKNTYISGPSHMGIYMGNGKYINANSAKKGVRIDSLYSDYTQKHLLGFGRF